MRVTPDTAEPGLDGGLSLGVRAPLLGSRATEVSCRTRLPEPKTMAASTSAAGSATSARLARTFHRGSAVVGRLARLARVALHSRRDDCYGSPASGRARAGHCRAAAILLAPSRLTRHRRRRGARARRGPSDSDEARFRANVVVDALPPLFGPAVLPGPFDYAKLATSDAVVQHVARETGVTPDAAASRA